MLPKSAADEGLRGGELSAGEWLTLDMSRWTVQGASSVCTVWRTTFTASWSVRRTTGMYRSAVQSGPSGGTGFCFLHA